MKERPGKHELSQYLSGWKEIANYLGKGVRTAQRYERELGLPVRRPAGKSAGSVVAVKAELDGWVQASPIRESYPLQENDTKKAYEESARSIKVAVAETRRLRDQMMELRLQVRQSVELLRHSVNELQGGLVPNQRKEVSLSIAQMAGEDVRENELNLIRPYRNSAKVS
ncbi:MAG TPA: hypothetical protein VHW45_17425 [Candidatus Sulfotelmatobacter sp.]|nr:hypothetical protein [Candidatus Sulfotelmatobacter sp.]